MNRNISPYPMPTGVPDKLVEQYKLKGVKLNGGFKTITLNLQFLYQYLICTKEIDRMGLNG